MPDPGPNLYLKQLRIRDLCGIETLELDFLSEAGSPRGLTVALADNGSGKTTLLRALALGLSPKRVTESLLDRFDGLWSRVDRSADPSAEPVGPPEIEITFIDSEDPDTLYRTRTVVQMAEDGSLTIDRELEPQPFPWQSVWAAGYGVHRGVDPGVEPFSSSQRAHALAGLFVDYPTSIGPDEALKTLHDQASTEQFNGVVEQLFALWQVEPPPREDEGEAENADQRVEMSAASDVHVVGPWGSLPFAALGDGYRATAHWFLDLCRRCWAADHLSPTGRPRGVALVDLVDLHQHPAKQKSLVPALRRLFPDLQLVVTTQSPLLIVNCDDSELYRIDARQPEAAWPLGSAKKRMIDTVLRGEWFGLVSTLDQESDALLQRFQLAVRNREPKEKIREYRAAVEQQIGRLFESPLEPMALEIVEETRRQAAAKRLAGRRFRDLGAMEQASLGSSRRRGLAEISQGFPRGARSARDPGAEPPETAALEESYEELEDHLSFESMAPGGPAPEPTSDEVGLTRSAPDEVAPDEAAPLVDEVREAAERLRLRMRSRSFGKRSAAEEDEP